VGWLRSSLLLLLLLLLLPRRPSSWARVFRLARLGKGSNSIVFERAWTLQARSFCLRALLPRAVPRRRALWPAGQNNILGRPRGSVSAAALSCRPGVVSTGRAYCELRAVAALRPRLWRRQRETGSGVLSWSLLAAFADRSERCGLWTRHHRAWPPTLSVIGNGDGGGGESDSELAADKSGAHTHTATTMTAAPTRLGQQAGMAGLKPSTLSLRDGFPRAGGA
jgi:hypothetical protein